MTFSELFTNNYEYLNTVAKRITRKKDIEMAPELLSTTYLVLHEKQTPFPNDNEEFVKWFSKCMKNYYVWPNSDFNKVYISKESLTIDDDYRKHTHDGQASRAGVFFTGSDSNKPNRHDDFIIDEDALRDIEVLVEDTNDFTRELIQISSNLGKEKTLKYIEVVEFKRSLPAHENILFELYYEKELSTRKIAELYSCPENKMNYQSVNQMINKIKVKLNNYQWR